MTLDARPSQPVPYPNIARLAGLAGMPVWIFDLEATTGDIKDPQFGIVEIGWVLVRADGSHTEGASWVDAGQPMNPFASRLTGIKNSHYAGAPTLEQLWPQISPMLHGSLCSGFGIHDFDCNALFHESSCFLGDEQGRHSLVRTLDARSLWTDHTGSPKGQLSEVAKHFGHADPSMHRALADAKACAKALDGLVLAMGPQRCLQSAREPWNPLVDMDRAAEKARAAQAALDAALALCKGCADFDQGLDILAAAGVRCHYSPKGFAWSIDGSNVKSPSAPRGPSELADHFGTARPRRLASPDGLARCEAAMLADPSLSDERAALLSLCRSSGSAAAARARAIRSGSMAPWTGVDPALRRLAESLAETDFDPALGERDILESLLHSDGGARFGKADSPALSACAASLMAQRSAPARPPNPRGKP